MPVLPRNLGLALVLAVTACSRAAGTGGTTQHAAGDTVDALRVQLLATVGSTCETSGQCRTRPAGAKPCGGPRTYLVYSIAATDTAALARAAARYYTADSARNASLGMVSDCAVVTAPPTGCVTGACRDLSARGEEHP